MFLSQLTTCVPVLQASAAGQSKASTLAEMLRMSNEELQTPVSGLRVCVESVLDSTADVAAASAAPAAAAPAVQQAVSGAVPVLLLRDDSLPDGTKSVGMYVHSRLRELFCGPHAPLGPGEPHIQTSRLPSWHQRNAFTPGIPDLRPAIPGFGAYGHERSDCLHSCRLPPAAGKLPAAAFTQGLGAAAAAAAHDGGGAGTGQLAGRRGAVLPAAHLLAVAGAASAVALASCQDPARPACLAGTGKGMLLAPFANKQSPFCFT